MTGKIPPKKSPARSHTVFENPNPDSTKADAHCAMESSDAPEHIMRMTAHIHAIILQFRIPIRVNNAVEMRVTPSQPQQ